jgi:hypothetical protein
VNTRAQDAGAIDPARHATAEAWVIMAIGHLGTIHRRLNLLDGELAGIVAARRQWMTGRAG